MANISDVYEMTFEASTEKLAIALEAYFKAIELTKPYYGTTEGVKREGKIITSEAGVMGRWVYSNNLEGTFERPEQWFDETLPKAEWLAVLNKLKKGDTISVSYSEDEPGCEVYQDVAGEIGWNDREKNVYVSLDFEEHDRPDCLIEQTATGKFYCEDHDIEMSEDPGRYCSEV